MSQIERVLVGLDLQKKAPAGAEPATGE